MHNNKIIIGYKERGDIDYLGTIETSKEMKEAIKKIEEKEYRLLETEKSHGLYEGYEMEWTFEYEKKKARDKILVVRSEQKYKDDRKRREKGIKKYIASIEELKGKLNKREYKKKEKVEERVNTLKKETGDSKYVETEIEINTEKKIEIKYKINEEKVMEAGKLDGKFVIATSRKELTAEEMLKIYKKRDISEKTFSTLKGTLYIRPVFLHKEERIESLVLLSIIALLVYSILKMQLIEKEVKMSADKALYAFRNYGVMYIHFIDDSVYKSAEDLNEMQKFILDKLGFPYPAEYINS
jgi:transposase